MNDRNHWNSRAKTYPRYEAGENNYEAGNLRRIAENGIDFTGKQVLDIGCGSGMYTIRIAQLAMAVTALDISDEMLRILAEDAAKMGLANITPVNADWMAYQVSKRYDIIFAAMTPALFSDEAKEKLLSCERDKIVFMAYAGRQYSSILGPLYDRQKRDRPFLQEADIMQGWLDRHGIAYTAVPVEGQWIQYRTEAEIRAHAQSGKSHPAIPDGWLVPFYDAETGKYKEITEYCIRIVII